MTSRDDECLQAVDMPAWTGTYRCVKCHHGRHLIAWAGANVYGPLGADGKLTEHEAVEEWGVYEDSIQCTKHPDKVIEKLWGGKWCRWWNCPSCNGTGERESDFRTYPCQAGGTRGRSFGLATGRSRGR